MIPSRLSLTVNAQFYLIVSASFAFAALQNVTVDDAVLTGLVVPQYLPSDSVWNSGNNCSLCLLRPNPSLAYNGTWHDTTYSPTRPYTQAIDFTFTGSALYIFFIISNNFSYTTFTNVEFVLDQVPVSTYLHGPSTSADFQYNISVYADDSLSPGQHNMRIQPINSGNDMVILFDYLIYTIDTSTSVLPSISAATSTGTPFPSASTTALPSPNSSGRTSLVPKVGAIAGGTVGGVIVIAVLSASLLCYWRRKRERSPVGVVVAPFTLSHETAPTTLTTASTHPVSSVFEPVPRIKVGSSSVASRPPNPPRPNAVPGAVPSSNDSTLLEQLEQLRDEVARLRRLQDSNRNTPEVQLGVPSSSDNVALLGQIEILRNKVARLHRLQDPNRDFTDVPMEAPPEYG